MILAKYVLIVVSVAVVQSTLKVFKKICLVYFVLKKIF